MTPLQVNVLKLIGGMFCAGLWAWMDYTGMNDPVLKAYIQGGLAIVLGHQLGSSPK